MPKSKRNKIVHLTQVKKKGKDHKDDLMKQLEQNVAQFQRVFIFDFDKTKSDRIMALRLKLKPFGKIFAGRNSLVSVTLKTIGSRTNRDFEELIAQVVGHRGLLFTDVSSDKLIELLERDLPEFCKKLLGYANISPQTALEEASMDLDRDVDKEGAGDSEEEEQQQQEEKEADVRARKKKAVSTVLKSKKTMKRSAEKKKTTSAAKGTDVEEEAKAKRKKSARREVKFVRI